MRISDWSSDVCSSDLLEIDGRVLALDHDLAGRQVVQRDPLDATAVAGLVALDAEGLEGFRDRHGPASRGGKGVPMMPVNAAAFHRGRSGRAVAVAATVSGHNAAMFDTPADLLTVAISSRALFDLEESNTLFEAQGIDAYAEHQRSREDDVLEPGIAFPLVRKLLALNAGAPAESPRVAVILHRQRVV